MIYTTLKDNKAHGNSNWDIIVYYDELVESVSCLFGDEYHDEWDNTDFDKLFQDYTERQVASKCLKSLKSIAYDKEDDFLMMWGKIFIELSCGDIAYDQLKELIETGVITGSKQLKEIERKAKRYGVTIKKEIEYDTENHYYCFVYISDLIDEYFPCHADLHDDFCNNCGNCQ